MRAGILGPREVFSLFQRGCPGGLVTRLSCWSWLWFWANCAAFLYSPKRKLMQPMEPYGHEVEGSWHDFDQFFQNHCFLWPWGWRVAAWVRPIFQSLCSPFSVANGMNQSHGMSRTHGMSFTNCRRGQYKPRAIFFIFLSKSCREFISWRDLNIRQKPK